MDMFAVDEEVARWERDLLPLRGAARLPVLAPLAWHLRQRDSARALALAVEALALLDGAPHDHDARDAALLTARMHLVQGEACWLQGALDQADALAHAASAALQAPGAASGDATTTFDALRADIHWLHAWVAVDRGDHARCDTEMALAAACARTAGDTERLIVAEAVGARWIVLRDVHAAAGSSAHFAELAAGATPATATWIHDFLGIHASLSSDFSAAAGHYMQCYEAALATGQLRAAITAATNIGEDFTLLNDHQSALEWMQYALDLARPTGWPRSVGACLMHTADTMRRLGRLDAAGELLQEALTILAPLAGARSYAIGLKYLGDLALDQGDYARALDAFERLALRADALRQADFQTVARRGQAHALSFLDRPLPALDAALAAVTLAAGQRNAYHHIAALRVLATLYRRHGEAPGALPAPPGMTELNPTLHYLHQALAVASTIDGYTLPGDLLDALAGEYARAGSFERAYEMALAASAARDKTHSQEATNRAIAMQVHHQTEHARAEGLHHRELAASEARRAELLQQTTATLERLSAIGREITTYLDTGAVFAALNRHVQALLPAHTFSVYLSEPGGAVLNRAFGIAAGQKLPPHRVPLSDGGDHCARSLNERREVYAEQQPFAPHADSRSDNDAGQTGGSACALFVPLLVGERALGVMMVQALQERAYGERERLIFRTLCAYGAIALDNAHAYRQLQDAQTQLVSQEKLAALGSLMAGVAHELNTPIGNSLLIASTLQHKSEDIERLLNGPGLRRSELAAYVADARKASELVMRGLHSAADLVNSFKQVAVDRTTEQRRRFDLQQVTRELIATMMNRIRAANHRIELDVPELLMLDSYPGPFGQVISNLVNNALLHAFGGRESGGTMRLTACPAQPGHVCIAFSDDGSGIAPEHVGRIFDPFFTTKLGQGGSGLGLSISYNIVTSLLGGTIEVASGAGGTTFTLELPMVAPQHDPASTPLIYH